MLNLKRSRWKEWKKRVRNEDRPQDSGRNQRASK
jgi:hypothetical protein